MDFETWLKYGHDNGWISDVFCNTHDGGFAAMTEEEEKEWDEGLDPCMFVVRVWEID